MNEIQVEGRKAIIEYDISVYKFQTFTFAPSGKLESSKGLHGKSTWHLNGDKICISVDDGEITIDGVVRCDIITGLIIKGGNTSDDFIAVLFGETDYGELIAKICFLINQNERIITKDSNFILPDEVRKWVDNFKKEVQEHVLKEIYKILNDYWVKRVLTEQSKFKRLTGLSIIPSNLSKNDKKPSPLLTSELLKLSPELFFNKATHWGSWIVKTIKQKEFASNPPQLLKFIKKSKINPEDLLGTEWHIKFPETIHFNSTFYVFCPHGKLCSPISFSPVPYHDILGGNWSVTDDIVTMSTFDGDLIYHGILVDNVLAGQARKTNGKECAFKGELVSKNVEIPSKPSSFNSIKSNEQTLNKYQILYLYHMTHWSNLENILKNGLFSRNQAQKGFLNIDIADKAVNIRRDRQEPIYNKSLHDYVPLYFNPKNPMLFKRKNMQNEIVILAIDRNVLLQANAIFTNGNAAAKITHFYREIDNLSQLYWKCIHAEHWNDFTDGKRIRCAEVLVYSRIDISAIKKIICNNFELQQIVSSQIEKYKNLIAEVNKNLYFNKPL